MNDALTIYKEEVKDFINIDFKIKKLDSSCNFSEGPVWNEEGFYLFSDIPENIIYKISEEGKKEVFLHNSGYNGNRKMLSEQVGSNGLTYDNEGNLLICQHGNGAVAKFNGEYVINFIDDYEGKSFNSPNDIVVNKSGDVFFSDPPYGLKDQQLQPENYQPLAAFYCYRNGELKIITDQYKYPNGLCLSADQQTLFTCSARDSEKFILAFDVETLQLKNRVADENSDGMKTDQYDNLYLTNDEGVVIINTKGERLAKIALATEPANICWGGSHLKDLFITARNNIFLIKDILK